jgi:choline dehydrogenase-like flavoprotein
MTGPQFDAEFIIVGSGPAGVSAAIPLAAAGRRVLMIDGSGPSPVPRADGSDRPSRAALVLGEQLEGLQPDDGLSPKLRTPAARHIVGGFRQWANIADHNFTAVGALARGGLSQIWGAFVSELDEHDLADWPLQVADLRPSYRAVGDRIGISGSSDDDMAAFYGLSSPILPAAEIGPAARMILERYRRTERRDGFSLGLARNALLTADRPGRLACDGRLDCLWGCPRGAIYDARYDLLDLQKHPTFQLIDNSLVIELRREANGWSVITNAGRSLSAPRVLLAAGALGTLRLVAPLLPDQMSPQIRLLSSPVIATPMLIPRRLGLPAPQSGFTLAQLGYALYDGKHRDDYVNGSLYEIAALPASSFVARLPLGRRAGTELFHALAPALAVATTYFPGRFSDNMIRLRRQAHGIQIEIRGGFSGDFEAEVSKTRKRLSRIWRHLGAWPVPGASIAKPGMDVHFGGLFPMGLDKANGTSAFGELNAVPSVFVVDGAAHPTVPAKFITLTIMANADRIGRHLAPSAN